MRGRDLVEEDTYVCAYTSCAAVVRCCSMEIPVPVLSYNLTNSM